MRIKSIPSKLNLFSAFEKDLPISSTKKDLNSSTSSKDLKSLTPATTRSPPNPTNNGKTYVTWKLWKTLLCTCLFGVLTYVFLLIFNSPTTKQGKVVQTKFEKSHQVTVMLNTFKRPEMMEDAIAYYSACSLVKHIYVIWSESPTLPQWIEAKYHKDVANKKVSVLAQPTPSLNNRFLPLNGYPHTDAIFSTDDDMRVPCDDLEVAYSVWRGSSNSLIGYMPRIHLRGHDGQLIYRCWWRVWWHGAYSIILTKAAFFHHKYLEIYSTQMPATIRDLVDKERNCEDIAMQFLISNVTRLPPIYVKGHLVDLGALNGISTSKSVVSAGHMDRRSQCLNSLVDIYGYNPLISSHIIVDNADNGWTNAPSTWLEFISSDLWKW